MFCEMNVFKISYMKNKVDLEDVHVVIFFLIISFLKERKCAYMITLLSVPPVTTSEPVEWFSQNLV
jgi:hypothetical protein